MTQLISRDDARLAGLKRFFTGEPCKHGHVAQRLVSSGSCVVCHASRSLKNYHANAERIIQRVIDHREKNRDAHNRTRRAHWARNRDRFALKKREYRIRNVEVVRERDRKRSKVAKWWSTPQGMALYSSRRNRFARTMWGDKEEIRNIYVEAAYHQMQVDHIVPLISDVVCGLHVEDNLQLLTPAENQSKGNRFDPDTYIHTVPNR